MIGARLKRFEDSRLLTGRGRFADDARAPGALHAAFVRSPHAHADIERIDAGAARAVAGVLGAFTGKDLLADGVSLAPTGLEGRAHLYPGPGGAPMAEPPYRVLALDRARHAGEAVAMVVAEDAGMAEAAAEAVAVAYRPRPAVTDAVLAGAKGAPLLWDEAPGNLCYDWRAGDADAAEAALAAAAQVARLEVKIPRLVPAFMEPKAALATYDAGTGRFEITLGCQSVHGLRAKLARTLGIEEARIRVISRDVGGAFGARSVMYPEYACLLWAARRLGRPVRWRASRAEEFLATTQGRDSVLAGRLGLDAAGRFTALAVSGTANMGARHTGNGPFSVMRNMARMLPGVYAIPAASFALKGVFTSTVPVSSYRGVGRMEAIYLLERLIDRAARETGRDRVALRRANLVAPDAMPFATAMGAVYDSGDYARSMDMAMAAADWQGFEARRAESARCGRLRGIGLINFIEGAGGSPGEHAGIAVAADGCITGWAGCVSQGQGHETTLAQIAADALGIAAEDVALAASDTALVPLGVGTNASRSMVRAGAALAAACRRLIADGLPLAARLMQVAPETVRFEAGAWHADGGRTVTLAELAAEAEGGQGLAAAARDTEQTVTYPNGCHVCEVEVDPETGVVDVVRFAAVDDVGRAVNPAIVRGQSQGAIAQGIGQALLEAHVHDLATGQPLTASWMDYAMPRAGVLPPLRPIANDVPSPTNALGVKGAGEGGTTGAPAAVMCAVLDALAPAGVRELDMPATPERIWRALAQARG